MITAFRIVKTAYSASAFDGEGARLFGGRWNSIGTRMVYLASTLSAATLELLVHTEDYSTINGLFSYIPVNIPDQLIHTLDTRLLPNEWNAPLPIATTQRIGDNWTASNVSAVLSVPSAITNGEQNYLLNPTHPDFKQINPGHPTRFKLDPRLL